MNIKKSFQIGKIFKNDRYQFFPKKLKKIMEKVKFDIHKRMDDLFFGEQENGR